MSGETSDVVEVVIGVVRRSESIAQLATALALAQGEIGGAAKSKVNPHFKSSYADLAEVSDACRPALSKHGIAVVQMPSAQGPRVTLTTLLAHKSGEWIESALEMTAGQNTPQAIGSCITYARRYALASMVGVAPEDDDANEASRPQTTGLQGLPAAKPSAPPKYAAFVDDMTAKADEGMVALTKAMNEAPKDLRLYLTTQDTAKWEAMKVRAAKVRASA